MKLLIIFLSLLILNCFYSFAQNNDILLRPENGKEYFYQFTDLQYIANENGEKLRELRIQKTLHIKFSNVKTQNIELLQVKVIQNKAEKPLDKPVQITDYMYPYLKGTYFGKRYDNFYEELLCGIEFLYEFDYENSEVKLYNRVDVLLKVREILQRKDFDKKGIERYTTEFNEKGIPEITKRLNSIYQISMDSESEINNAEEYKTKVIVKDSFGNISAKRWDKKPGLYSLNILSHLKEYYLKNYNRIEIDSTKQNGWATRNPDKQFYHEEDIRLLRHKNISENHFTISGKIENPKYKKVTLAVLRNPFGTNLHEESVFLDENNSFHIVTELKHPGIVMLQLGHKNQSRELPILLIYAEPGGRIELIARGGTFLGEVDFTGDFSIAAKMMYEFRKKYNLDDKHNLETTFWNSFSSKIEYDDFETALKDYDSFSNLYRNEIDETAFEFLNKEMKAQLFAGVLYYLDRVKESVNSKIVPYYFKDSEKIDFELLQKYFDTNSIYELYNEFGIFSRLLARDYLTYEIGRAVQNQELFRTELDRFITLTSHHWLYLDFPLNVELAKVMLSGHAYYSSVAEVLQHLKTNVDNEFTKNDELVQLKVDEYLDLILRLCNNDEFAEALKGIQSNYQNWEKTDFVPTDKFLNVKGEEIYLKNFLGEKPTVFYVVQNWGTERYFFDDLAKENPDINFVMIMEGNIFEEWTDYLKRAKPVAHQLFLFKGEKGLKDIFRKSSKHLIVYDKNGIRFAFAGNPLSAKNYAKQSLKPKKKELNKSQLEFIIVVLGVVLAAFFIGFFIWKWRVRLRLKKEQQFRKLRELELTAIRSQMNPHFLFNSLNSVQNLVQQNKGREAHLYLADFAGLIRKVLQNSEKEEVSLAEELKMTKQYLNLEKLRFDFNFLINVEKEIDQHNTFVPAMLLQPFVENAVVHGLQSKKENCKLEIEIIKENSGIKISIEDNGIGRAEAKKIAKEKNGKGTKLIKERLEILQQKQGEKYEMNIVDLDEGKTGTRVEILIPEEK